MIRHAATVCLVLSLSAPAVYGQEPVAPPVTSIRASIDKVRLDLPSTPGRNVTPQVRFQQQNQVSKGTKVKAGVVGGVAGFFVGGILGGILEPPCGCDDPGLKGVSIGAPIGALIGAIGLVKLASE